MDPTSAPSAMAPAPFRIQNTIPMIPNRKKESTAHTAMDMDANHATTKPIDMSIAEPVYVHGFPLFWGNEESCLKPAVEAYMGFCCGSGPEPTAEQMKWVCWYFNYHVNAPCWDDNPHHDDTSREELAELRRRSTELASVESCRRYIEEAAEIGLDPL